MFTSVSMAGTGAIVVVVVELLLKLAGVEVEEGTTLEAVNAVVTAAGYVLLVWGQIRRKDLVAGLLRRDS